MRDRLARLRHHSVIGCDDEDRNVRDLRTTGTHGGERLVPWSVEEGDPATVQDGLVGAYVLGDPTRLGVDPARIVVAGYSAGGFLALFASGTQNEARYEGTGGNAGVPTTVAACLSYFAPAGSPAPRNLPLPPDSSEEAWQEVEIARHLKGMAPTAIFQGLADTLVTPEVSENLCKQLRANGTACELHEFGGVPHEFVQIPEFAANCAQLADFFLDRYVVNARTYPPFNGGRGGGGGGMGGGEAGMGAGDPPARGQGGGRGAG
jgi:pimeloyl-ACP methyl ester carboxylesterase